jgi:endonuclease YncB( thermonuclease family)
MVRWVIALALCVGTGAAAQDIVGRVAVVDGDTFRVGGTVVRLHGVDAPEQKQPCTDTSGTDWACGAWVTDQVRRAYAGKRVRCAPVTQDRYRRVVARCYRNGADIGQTLVREGLAFAFRRYSMDYDLDEKRAAVTGRGLHGHSVQAPAAFRRAQSAVPLPRDTACAIKGNISGNGRIYHMPGQEHYNRTRISTARGERWFCTEAEARAAGWRKARR